ncbi:MAG: DUF1513 domain-containing protein [Paracoccaceae bacterium]
MATRRVLLGQVAASLGVLACTRALGQPAGRAAYLGVETSAATGRSRARLYAASGEALGAVPLDLRAHGLARHEGTLAVFPRRPGNRLALIDEITLEVRATIAAPLGRHFYGHGAFTADGGHLLTTENDLDTLQGRIGVWEMRPAPARVAEIALPGPGPHDIRRIGATDRFHVALGGLMTHPDYGRTALNLAEFTSRIVTLDLGAEVARALDPLPGANGVSLRHIAADGRGRLYVGGQRQRPGGPGVVWLIEGGVARAVDTGDALGGYVSSVAASGDRALITSKATGAVLTLSGDRIVARARTDGASAAAMTAAGPVWSGHGLLTLPGGTARPSEGHEFDNHGLAPG